MRSFLWAVLIAVGATGVAPAQENGRPPAGRATGKTSAADAALLAELQEKMAAMGKPRPGAAAPAGAIATGAAAATTGGRANPLGLSNQYNPAISLNGLFLGTAASRPAAGLNDVPTGLDVQELEVQMMSNVDPYFLANMRLSMPGGEGIGLEEGFLQPTAMPSGFQARLGKLLIPFGRENALHTHALPFIDRSMVGNAVFGDEGLGEVGVELSYLFALPWYSVLAVGGYDGANQVEFGSPRNADFLGVATLRNLLDLSDDATFELGLSYAAGRNAALQLAQVLGAHLMIVWRPARNFRTRGITFVAEALYASHPNAQRPADATLADPAIGGAYAYLQARLALRWSAALRGDYLGFPDKGRGVGRRGTAILAFVPTEFSAIRLQANVTDDPGHPELVYGGLLQFNFTIGAHPAHSY